MMVLCPKCGKHVEYYESEEYKKSEEDTAKLITEYEERSKIWDKSDEWEDKVFWASILIMVLLFTVASLLGVS